MEVAQYCLWPQECTVYTAVHAHLYDHIFHSGQEPFRSLMPQFGRNALIAVVMCDVTRKETVDGAKLWKQAVDSSVFLTNGQPIPCVLLVNKVSPGVDSIRDSSETVLL